MWIQKWFIYHLYITQLDEKKALWEFKLKKGRKKNGRKKKEKKKEEKNTLLLHFILLDLQFDIIYVAAMYLF